MSRWCQYNREQGNITGLLSCRRALMPITGLQRADSQWGLGSAASSLFHLCWDLRWEGARLHDGGAAGTSCRAVPGCRKLRLEVPRPACAPQHSAWVHYNAQQLLPSWDFLLLPLETQAGGWDRPADIASLKSTEPPIRFLHGVSTSMTPWLPFMSLNLVLLYFHACRKRKQAGYLLSFHSQALKSWG